VGVKDAPTLTVGPVDVPRLRDRLIEYVTHPYNFLGQTLAIHTGGVMVPCHPARLGRPTTPWTLDEYLAAVTRWAQVAELFYITPDMTDVVAAAATAMPLYDLHPDNLPADIGLMVWGAPAVIVDDSAPAMTPGGRCEIRAALWARVGETGDGPGVHLITLQDTEVMLASRPQAAGQADLTRRLAGPLIYHDEYPLPYGNAPFGRTSAHPNSAVAAALTTWIMMGQRITTEAPAVMPRAVRRQAERAGRPTPAVRVVTLRRAAARTRPEAPESATAARTYTNRWVVRGYGYWRNTWYPSTQEHRLQFVHVPAYVKGPEGAPVIGGERVNVLRR
jgi:hypothetical protein